MRPARTRNIRAGIDAQQLDDALDCGVGGRGRSIRGRLAAGGAGAPGHRLQLTLLPARVRLRARDLQYRRARSRPKLNMCGYSERGLMAADA